MKRVKSKVKKRVRVARSFSERFEELYKYQVQTKKDCDKILLGLKEVETIEVIKQRCWEKLNKDQASNGTQIKVPE